MQATQQKTNRRNQHGVKNSCDQYRTINGEHWICWNWDTSAAVVSAYRTAGVRVRIIKGEMYIPSSETQKASAVAV